ncbi:MAG: M1 family metallopeptidase [Chitinophagaceae bacterium]|nr:M1 family metallopeptidase [Chitinophagaceae bacterium]
MKKRLLSVFILGLSFMSAAQSKIDVLHYIFRIELNDLDDTLYGEAAIRFVYTQNASAIEIDLENINTTLKGMKVMTVKYPDGWPGEIVIKEASFSHKHNKIVIPRGEKTVKGDTGFFMISYKGVPADGLIISKNQFGKRTFFADNWPNRAHRWLPCNDDPSDKASVEFIVTAPSSYRVISNGVLMEESNLPGDKKLTHWKENVPLPTKVMVIGVADFAVQHAGFVNDCIPVSSWVYTENKDHGFYDYAIARDILAFFIDYIGPYAYKKLANVQSKTIFGGMENAGAIFYAEHTVNGLQTEERLIAHEIVHQWFGNMATEKSFAHFWLSEGFATYLTHIYLESKYGTDSLNKRMQEDRETVIDFVKNAKRPVVDSTPDYMRLLNANSYQKGGWVLHMLRRQLGDSIFKESIRQYYATYAGKNADTKDLQQIFEKVSGRGLEQFFKQWLYTPENPSLKIKWKNLSKENKVAITVEQQQNTVFEFPLDLYFTTGLRKNKGEKLFISKKTETFYFSVTGPVIKVDADHTTSLLSEISIQQVN